MKLIITPFALVLIPAFLVSVGLAIYHLSIQKDSPEAMTGILAIIMAFVFALVFFVEQVLARNQGNVRRLKIFEGIGMGVLAISWYLMISEVILLHVEDRTQWFVTFYYPGKTQVSFSRSILKEQVLTLEENKVLLLNDEERTTPVLTKAKTGQWKEGYWNKEINMDVEGSHLSGVIYTPAGTRLTEAELEKVNDAVRVALNRSGF